MSFPASVHPRRALAAFAVVLAGCGAAGEPEATQMAQNEFLPPPSGQILTVDGLRVHAQVEGSGPDVILLHGAGGNLRDFTFDLVERLSDDFRVIAFDRPGLGYSDPIPGWVSSPPEQAALLDRAAAELGVERAIVVGHSFGGAVAMAWALDRPERVAGLVSVSGAVQPWEGGLGPWYRIAGSRIGGALLVPIVASAVNRSRAESVVAEIFAPNPVPDGYIEHIGIGLSARPETLRANARQVNELKPYLVEMSPRYPTLDIPVEIVHGNADDTVPLDVHSRPLADQVPGANLTVLDGVGHMPHHVRPEAVVDAIHRAADRAGLR